MNTVKNRCILSQIGIINMKYHTFSMCSTCVIDRREFDHFYLRLIVSKWDILTAVEYLLKAIFLWSLTAPQRSIQYTGLSLHLFYTFWTMQINILLSTVSLKGSLPINETLIIVCPYLHSLISPSFFHISLPFVTAQIPTRHIRHS